MPDLSILICSVHTRWQTFGQAIQRQVWQQYNALPPDYRDRLEILMLTDTKTMTVGHKRNLLVAMASGRYVQFIDDDDRIEPDMFLSVLDATVTDVDVITFLVSVSLNGQPPKLCRYSKDFPSDRNTATGYQRLPNHICAVKRELAAQVSFPNVDCWEDAEYSKRLRPLLRTEHYLDRVLYHYDFSVATTEAQDHLRTPARAPRPIVDVVMPSRAATPKLAQMTQHAIDTCVIGANSLPVNIIVLEQIAGVSYRDATVIAAPKEFNINAFANRGAALGSADWIMVANNDLVFHPGWLHHLLAANHPVVSPKNPGDSRQVHIVNNTSGFVNGTHFSGWCFMIARRLWAEMGGFDADFAMWCADDAIVEQLRAHNVAPMLVPGAVVEHLESVTLNVVANRDELTWGCVRLFNAKYGRAMFVNDAGFRAWQQAHPVTPGSV